MASKASTLADAIRQKARNEARENGMAESQLNDYAFGALSMLLASRYIPIIEDGELVYVYFNDVTFDGENYVRTRS